MPECVDESSGVNFEKDQYLTTNSKSTKKWTIISKIGEGGYGSVYKVKDDNSGIYAMKIETKSERRDHYKLSMEYHVMKAIQNSPRSPGIISHFIEAIDKGRKEQYCFIIMPLLGESLAELRKKNYPPVFSLGTAYGMALQCLEAIQELHNIGFIHRDIKPGNYAIGRDDKRGTAYILDFGIARKIWNDKGELKAPRVKVSFRGTVRYAALACHRNKELGTKDDVESWLYIVVDFGNPDGCIWRGEKNKDKVRRLKEEARTVQGRERMFKGLDGDQFALIMEYIDERTYSDRLDYEYIMRLLKRAARHANVSTHSPYDWEIPETEKKKPGSSPATPVKQHSDDKINFNSGKMVQAKAGPSNNTISAFVTSMENKASKGD